MNELNNVPVALPEKTVTLKLDKDFTVVADHASLRIETGETAQYNLTLTPVRGFTGDVSLFIKDCPQEFTAVFTPNPLALSKESAQTLLKMIPTAEVKSGSYSMIVTATGGGRSHDLSLSLDLTDFQITVNPTTQTVQQLGEASYTLTLNPISGFDNQVTLEIDGIPRGMKANLSSNQVTLPKDVTLALGTSKWLLPGTYEISISAKGRVINHETAATLVVHKNPGIALGIVTAPGPLNEPIINTFGPDGDLLSHFEAFDKKSSVNISAGDVDGDGIDEIIAATSWKLPKTPALLGIFKKDGTKAALMETEYRSRYGLTLAVGDMDGDWVEDIAMGYYESAKEDDDEDDFEGWDKFNFTCSHSARGHGGVRIYQFIGQKFIDTGLALYPYDNERYRGAPNLAIADVDGDGIPELITAPGPDPCAPAKIEVFKIDTKDGVGRWKVTSKIAEFIVSFDDKKRGFGANIAAGDLDGDGSAEIIVGAGPDPRNPSIVKVYRGDGTFTGIEFKAYPDVSHDRNKDQLNRFGVNVAVGDLEMDGISEIITGMGPGPMNEGWVRMFDGDGILIGDGFLAYPKDTRFGVRVSTGNIGE